MHRLIPAVLVCLLAVSVGAEVYKRVDEDGNIIYSDQPHPEAEVLDNLEVPTVEFRDAPPPPRAQPTRREAQPYRGVSITSPAAEATLRDNQGNVSVSVSVQPVLQVAFGHKLALYVDGSVYGEPGTATSFRLENVDRGTHTLRAAVLDAGGSSVAGSDTVTFYLHRQFIRQGN